MTTVCKCPKSLSILCLFPIYSYLSFRLFCEIFIYCTYVVICNVSVKNKHETQFHMLKLTIVSVKFKLNVIISKKKNDHHKK